MDSGDTFLCLLLILASVQATLNLQAPLFAPKTATPFSTFCFFVFTNFTLCLRLKQVTSDFIYTWSITTACRLYLRGFLLAVTKAPNTYLLFSHIQRVRCFQSAKGFFFWIYIYHKLPSYIDTHK